MVGSGRWDIYFPFLFVGAPLKHPLLISGREVNKEGGYLDLSRKPNPIHLSHELKLWDDVMGVSQSCSSPLRCYSMHATPPPLVQGGSSVWVLICSFLEGGNPETTNFHMHT